MPRYGDDQCVECGGVRAAKSTLCASCLVKACALRDKTIRHLTEKKEALEKRIENYRGQLKDSLVYGFKQNQKVVELETRIKRMSNIALRRIPDEKGRV